MRDGPAERPGREEPGIVILDRVGVGLDILRPDEPVVGAERRAGVEDVVGDGGEAGGSEGVGGEAGVLGGCGHGFGSLGLGVFSGRGAVVA